MQFTKSSLAGAALAAFAAALCTLPAPALACSSCGCTLNADWGSQGFKSGEGLSVDLRQDRYHQRQLRSGTGTFNAGAVELPAEQELQQTTDNRVTTLTLDYGFASGWGLSLQVPHVARDHTTIAEGDTEVSSSHSSGIGDVRVVARYQGFSEARDWGLQLGLKFATGATDVNFSRGPQAGGALDAGLQPGTGSTDLLLGAYRFGNLSGRIDHFSHASVQVPLNSKNGFKPGVGLNFSTGLRYASDGPVVPQVQLNARIEGRESGENADIPNSGATLVYLSPGATWALGEKLSAYGFVQVPMYQRVNGLQLEPKLSVSVGLRYGF